MKTQCERLLKALRRRSMTTAQIRDQLGIGHPAGRVQELRAKGFDISTEMVERRNRYKEKAYVAKYSLEEKRAA